MPSENTRYNSSMADCSPARRRRTSSGHDWESAVWPLRFTAAPRTFAGACEERDSALVSGTGDTHAAVPRTLELVISQNLGSKFREPALPQHWDTGLVLCLPYRSFGSENPCTESYHYS